MKLFCRNPFVLAALMCFCFWVHSAQANVYATDIKLNGSLGATVILPGQGVTINYILNDTATGGVWIQIDSGTNVIATLSSTNGAAGTNVGLNTVYWDGVPDNATNLAEGTYTVSITAASTGYCAWTNITDDSSNFSVYLPRGIAVDRNTNSPYYGRVYVGNAYANDVNVPSERIGIFKRNADGSPADDGGFSTGGWNWAGDKYSPWKMTMGADDRLYVDDFTQQGVVVSFDATVQTNDIREVVRNDNYPSQHPLADFSGLVLTGPATNQQIWMTDEDPANGDNPYGSAGVIAWQLTSAGIVATNDMGTNILPTDPWFLTKAPYDISLDPSGFIYLIQYLTWSDGPAYSVMSFPPYDGGPSMADWASDMYPKLKYASGVAADPVTNYLAVAVLGSADTESDHAGGLYLFNSTNGEFITDVDQTGGDPYYAATWDNVGNLYAIDGGSNGVWRVYSPPGTNQATTVAVPIIQAYSQIQPPSLLGAASATNKMRFTLAGQSYITYVIQRSCDFTNWTYVLTSYSANSNRCISVPICGTQNFYRAMTVPP